MFDTRQQHKRLVEAGFSDPQSEAIVDVATAVLECVATKADLQIFETKLEGRFAAIDARFETIDSRFVAFDTQFGRLWGMMVAIFVAVVGSGVAYNLHH